jgi:hypothetical protein
MGRWGTFLGTSSVICGEAPDGRLRAASRKGRRSEDGGRKGAGSEHDSRDDNGRDGLRPASGRRHDDHFLS